MPWAAVLVGTIVAARSQSSASRRAAETEERTSTEALDFERERETHRREEWDRMMAAEEAQWNAEQERLEPYRHASRSALADLNRLAGYSQAPQSERRAPNFNRPMPEDWQPGDPLPTDPTAPGPAPEPEPEEPSLMDRMGGTPRSYAASEQPAPYSPEATGTQPIGEISEEVYRPLARQPLSALGRRRVR